jgi:hypothetical protein
MLHRCLSLISLLLPLIVHAAPMTPAQIPEQLKPWAEWALWPDKSLNCPHLGAAGEATRPCVWPASLKLELDGHGGRFDLDVRVYAEQPVTLPGDAAHWPLSVQADGRAIGVIQSEGRPRLRLPPGAHQLSGRFEWDRPPPALSIPTDLGLIALSLNGQTVAFPALNEQGQLWLDPQAGDSASAESADALEVRVFRQVIDGVPTRLLTHVELDAAGKTREIVLPVALLPKAIPMSLVSGLPARLDAEGRLRVQVRAGHWQLDLESRQPGEITELALSTFAPPWPEEEIWSFAADNAVRLVEVEGVNAIDPRQTSLPDDWKSLPAFRLRPGDTFRLRVIRRGDPEPEPDRLTLNRKLWLDFDGGGFTASDQIGGQMTRDWRLNAGEGMTLGRVAIDGAPLSITQDQGTGLAGVEVRRGTLNVSADSRLPATRTLPATGWRKDFQSVRAELNLPPGWRLFAAMGVDTSRGSWMDAWTLLDFFIVLTLTLAAGRLWDWRTAALTLITLTLIWQEPEAPRYTWINLLAATALLRVVPAGESPGAREGAFLRGLRTYRLLAVALLVLAAIPFVGQQIRLGLYPQLERPWAEYETRTLGETQDYVPSAGAAAEAVNEAMDAAPPPPSPAPLDKALSRRQRAAAKTVKPSAPTLRPDEIDPNAITQTGPGLPRWSWNRFSLNWKGPVPMGQDVTLILLSPAVNLGLSLLRVALLAGLGALLLLGSWPWPSWRPRDGQALVLALLVIAAAPRARAAEFPGPELLNELRARLTAPAECLPHCADIAVMSVTAQGSELRVELEVEAEAAVGLPLPAQSGQWLPARVELDGEPAPALIRTDDGQLWLGLEPGHHRVLLTGPLPGVEQVTLPLPLKPHRVKSSVSDWKIEGIGDNGVPDLQLRLVRPSSQPEAGAARAAENRPLPVFAEVERTLHLGLEWRLATRVRRLTPPDSASSLEIPLVPGEAVLTADLPVREGKVVLNLPAGQSEAAWESALPIKSDIILTAPASRDWTEIWRLDASPIWHVESSGLTVVHHQSPAGRWQPEWRPWAGESVTLNITRPASAPGATLTLDATELSLRPGERSTEATLNLSLRSSRGGQFPLTLPPEARLQTVRLDGVQQPIRQDGASVVLPVHPGSQSAVISWLDSQGVSTLLRGPEVRLGAASVNARQTIQLSQNRWVLLAGGPRLGPAVLFWSLLATLVLLGFGLSRIPGSPARFWQWTLLLIGLSQTTLMGATVVVVWLLALAWRGKAEFHGTDREFKALQLSLAALTVLSVFILMGAVAGGLLGLPSMQIAGNGSSAYQLIWYQDRSPETLPRPWVVSVPLWLYRALMLAWALWLANTVLNWLKWGWNCFTTGGLWNRRTDSTT